MNEADKKAFAERLRKATLDVGAPLVGSINADVWTQEVAAAIDTAAVNLEAVGHQFTRVGEHYLKGHLAEAFHEGTFNVNAAVSRSSANAVRHGRTDLGSPDLTVSGGQHPPVDVQVKYYRSDVDTAKAVSSPNYGDMKKVVPSEQVDGVRAEAARLADKNHGTRPEQAAQYEHTANNASSQVEYEGISSRPLSEQEALEMAREAKRGELNGERHGLNMDDSISWKNVANEALGAGVQAAAIGAAAAATPYIAKMLKSAWKNGELDVEALRDGGLAALRGGTQSGLRGTVSAGVLIAARKGALGTSMKNISPGAVGSIVAFTLVAMGDTYALVNGDIDSKEYGHRCIVNGATSAGGYGGAVVGQALIPIPVLGGMIGGIVGATLASAGVAGVSNALDDLEFSTSNIEALQELAFDTVILHEMTAAGLEELDERLERLERSVERLEAWVAASKARTQMQRAETEAMMDRVSSLLDSDLREQLTQRGVRRYSGAERQALLNEANRLLDQRDPHLKLVELDD